MYRAEPSSCQWRLRCHHEFTNISWGELHVNYVWSSAECACAETAGKQQSSAIIGSKISSPERPVLRTHHTARATQHTQHTRAQAHRGSLRHSHARSYYIQTLRLEVCSLWVG